MDSKSSSRVIGTPAPLSPHISVSQLLIQLAQAKISALPIFAGCWIGWKYIKGTKFVHLAEMDFQTGRRELDEMEERDAEIFKPETRFQKIMSILF